MSNHNILVPLITPFNENLNVCRDSVIKLIGHIEKHAVGIIPCLTSGEGWLLPEIQWTEMVSYCMKHAHGLNVIAGIEKATTIEVLKYLKIANSIGVNGVMITTPFGANVSQVEMLSHYQTIHKNCNCDIWIYHENALSGNLLSLDTLLAISKLDRVVGIKDSGQDNSIIANRKLFSAMGVNVYHGWEERLLINVQDVGNIVSLSNLEADICQQASQSPYDNCLPTKIKSLCETYSLTAEDWYSHLKKELKKRGVISTDLVLSTKN